MSLQSAGEQLYGAGGVSTGLDVPTGKALFLEQGKADEIHKIPEKTTTTDNDVILIEDSEDGYKKKRVLAKNLKGKTGVDNAELWKQNTVYKADDVFHFSTSNVTAKWADGSPITPNSVYFAKYLVDTTSGNDLTNAEMAKFEVVSDGEKIDSSNFKAVGDENSIGINKNDNTLQKVINKVEDFKVTVPKAFEKVTLATDANLTALQALEPTTTKDDLLFEFKASDGTKSYIVTPLDSFIDLKAIKQIEYKSLDEDETILKITTIEGVESELDLKRFLAEKADKSWITSNADVDSDPQKHALFKGSDIYEVMQSMGTIIVAGDTFNIDDAMRGKPTTYTIIVTPDDTTKIQFTGQKWIEDAKYVSDEITLSKQQSLIIYNGESWKAKFVNSHSLPTKNLDVTDEFYEAKFTTQFVNIKMTHATPKIRFFLGTNGSTVIHNDGDKDLEVYGYISTAGKEPIGDTYILHSGETAIYNHLFGDASFVKLVEPIQKAQLGEIFVGTDETPKLHSPKNLKQEITLSENSNCLTKWNDTASWYGSDVAMDRVKFVLGADGIVYEALKSLIPKNTPITDTEHWKAVEEVSKETRFFDDVNDAEKETIEKDQLFVIGAETRNFYVGTYMNMGEPKKFSIIDPTKEIVQVVKGQSTLGKEFIVVDKIITKPYPTEPNHTNGLDVTENKILDSDGTSFSERTHNYRDGMIVSVKEGNLEYRYVKATNSFIKLTKSVDSEPLVASLPITDNSIVHDAWSPNDVGIDLTKATGYLMIGTRTSGATFIQPLRIELPMIAGEEYKGGNNAGNGVSSWQIRALTRTDSPTVVEVAGSFNPNSSHTSTLAYIKHYKEQSEVVDPNLVPVEDILEDEIKIVNIKKGDSEVVVDFAQSPDTILMYGDGFSDYGNMETISFKDLKSSGTLKLTMSGRSDISENASDSSEIWHIMYKLRYISDVSVGVEVVRAGYTEKAGDFASRAYAISKVIARYKTTKSIRNDGAVDLSKYMLKSDYDKDNNKVVDTVDNIDGGNF